MLQRAVAWTSVQITTFEHYQSLMRVIQERLDVLGCADTSLLMVRLTSVNLTTSKITSLRLLKIRPEDVDASFLVISQLLQSQRVVIEEGKGPELGLLASIRCQEVDQEGDEESCLGNTLPFHMYMDYSGPQSKATSPTNGDLLSALRRIKDNAMMAAD